MANGASVSPRHEMILPRFQSPQPGRVSHWFGGSGGLKAGPQSRSNWLGLVKPGLQLRQPTQRNQRPATLLCPAWQNEAQEDEVRHAVPQQHDCVRCQVLIVSPFQQRSCDVNASPSPPKIVSKALTEESQAPSALPAVCVSGTACLSQAARRRRASERPMAQCSARPLPLDSMPATALKQPKNKLNQLEN